MHPIVRSLREGPDVAGVTLMAFGNAAPDVITAITGLADANDFGIVIGNLLGGSTFILMVILGAVLRAAEKADEDDIGYVQLDKNTIVRDLVSYTLSIMLIIIFASTGSLQVWQALLLLGLYSVYVFYVFRNGHSSTGDILEDHLKHRAIAVTADHHLPRSRMNSESSVPSASPSPAKEKVETYNTLKRNALEPYEKDEPNDVSIVPVLIVMSHYEAFLEKASLKRRVVTNAIRVLAHTWGANVAGYDRRTKTTALMRSMLSKAAFGGDVRAKKKKKEESAAGDTGNETNATADPDQKQKEEKKGRVKLRRFGLSKKMIKLDAQAPIVVPVGADSHESIGAPPECDASEYATMSDSLKIKMWSKAVLKYYPDADRKDVDEEGEDEDESKKEKSDDKFADEVIDMLCAQKREELIKYRKASERQRRLKGE